MAESEKPTTPNPARIRVRANCAQRSRGASSVRPNYTCMGNSWEHGEIYGPTIRVRARTKPRGGRGKKKPNGRWDEIDVTEEYIREVTRAAAEKFGEGVLTFEAVGEPIVG